MCKYLFSLLFIVYTTICFGQTRGVKEFQECELFLKDSTTFRGFCKIVKKDKIEFTLERDSVPDIWDSKDIKSVRFFRSQRDQVLEYFNLRKNMPRLLEIKIYGDVMLYERNIYKKVSSTNYTVHTAPDGSRSPQASVPVYTGNGSKRKKRVIPLGHYLKRASSDTLLQINQSWSNKKWKKEMIKFFKDCPLLVEDLEADAYDKLSIEQLVEDYNLYCVE